MRIPTPRKLPSGKWFVQVRRDGKSYSFSGMDKDKVIADAVNFKAGLSAKKKLPATIGQAVDEYIQAMDRVLSPSTIKAYRSMRMHRFQRYMDMPIGRLDRLTAQRMVNEESSEVAPKTVKNAWRLISSALKMQDISLGNIALPSPSPSVRPFLDVSEIEVFLSYIKGKPWEIGALLALHGLRRSELYALTWDKVDLGRGTIQVSGALVDSVDGWVEKKTNKTRASARTVPIIIPRLQELLEQTEPKEGAVVTSHPNTLYHQVNKVCREAGLPEVGVHGLRHSLCSTCYAAGVDILTTARIGGWSTADMTTIRTVYTHLSEKQYEDGIEKLKGIFR